MKNLLRGIFILLAAGFPFLSFGLGGSAAKNIKLARTKTAPETLKCGPVAEAGVLTPAQLAGTLKKGTIVKILPGSYEKDIIINSDDIIIEGEPGKFCDANLTISGKDCIVRNLWVRYIECTLDFTCVDSVMTLFYSYEDSKGDLVFDNCCFSHIGVDSYNKNLYLNRCTLSSAGVGFWMWGSQIDIENSVIFSTDTLFVCAWRNKIKIDIINSVVGSSANFASDRGMTKVARTIADVKNSKLPCSVTAKKVFEEKASFEEGPSGCVLYSDSVTSRSGWSRTTSSLAKLKDFVLKDGSPGKKEGLGANLSPEGFPVPYETKASGTKTPPAVPASPAPAAQ